MDYSGTSPFKKHNIRTVGYVPDAGLTELIKSCHADNDIKSVVMTTEEEGIGLSSGAWLGVRRQRF